MRVGKLKNGKVAGKDEVTGKTINGGGELVIDWIWKLCNMAFESGVVTEDCEDVKRIPREGRKRFQKGENFSKRIKRSPGSTRAAAGVCVTSP